jgi:hypothetical protein
MHFLALWISYQYIFNKSFVHHVCKHSFPEIHEVDLRTLTERHVTTFRKQLINLLDQPIWAIPLKVCIQIKIKSQRSHSSMWGSVFNSHLKNTCMTVSLHWRGNNNTNFTAPLFIYYWSTRKVNRHVISV